jgi:hypothetical protein
VVCFPAQKARLETCLEEYESREITGMEQWWIPLIAKDAMNGAPPGISRLLF